MINNSPQLPTSAIAPDRTLNAKTENWFEYVIKIYPHHTDYAGIVWHGSYIQWLEEARIEYFRSIGVNYADLVNLGCEMPVVELAIRYHRSIRMDHHEVIIKTLLKMDGVRLNWDYEIVSLDRQELYITAQVTLVGIDAKKGKIMRQLPATVTDAITRKSN
jgi:acyl-CoA thioester hydrolase